MGADIFDGSDPNVNDEDLSKIEINKDFARRFEHNKKREELQRYEELKKKGVVASDGDDDSCSDEDDDDDDSDLDDPVKDRQLLDVLIRVKNGDPVINQKEVKLFADEDEEERGDRKKKKAKKERPLYLKDVNYQALMEAGPESELREEESRRNPKVYDKEQEKNVKAFLEAEKEAFGADDDDDIIKEMASNRDEMEEDENERETFEKLDEYFGPDDNLNEDDMFLKKYIAKRLWRDKEKGKKQNLDDDVDVSEDEDELEKQDRYEAEYNFRHEEVDGDRIQGHARFIEGSVRKISSSRKAQRKSKEERMVQAEFERKQELKHMKNLKKKEIQEKLERIQEIAGLGKDWECKLGADDLEEDFDPEEYDKKMKEIFNPDYYEAADVDPGFGSGDEGDLEKPDFDREDELLGLPKDWDSLHSSSNEEFEAVRDRISNQGEEGEEGEEEGKGESKRKRKRKISLKEKVELDKELEEYYKLDYEDTIGDLKTRFKYKAVPAKRFGLSAAEIFMADDKDLNQYVSLKRLAPYREKEWKVTHHQKLKKGLILHGENSDNNKPSKKHVAKEDASAAGMENKTEKHEEPNGDDTKISRRVKRRQRQAELKLSQSRLAAYGKDPSKPQKKN